MAEPTTGGLKTYQVDGITFTAIEPSYQVDGITFTAIEPSLANTGARVLANYSVLVGARGGCEA